MGSYLLIPIMTTSITKEIVENAKRYQPSPYRYSYDFKDTIFYNLSVGASAQPNQSEFRYVYENDPLFKPLPTMGTLPGLGFLDNLVNGEIPNLEVDLKSILHAEQYLKIIRPMKSNDVLENQYKIEDVLDKGKAANILVGVESRNMTGDVVLFNQVSLFLLGKGGWGGQKSSSCVIKTEDIPCRKPDFSKEYKTHTEQAAFYRLTGDLNPLHVDPKAAALLKFKCPILHGLCTVGIAVRDILEVFSREGDKEVSMTEMKVRMSSPVIPGQTLITELWKLTNESNELKQEDGIKENKDEIKVAFRTTVKENSSVCLSGGWIKLCAI